MIKAKKILKNSFIILSARVSEVAFSLIVSIMVARYLSVEGFGMYSFVLASIWILSPILFLGLNQVLARDIAVKPDSAGAAIGSGIMLNLSMVLPLIACALVIMQVFNMDKTTVAALFITIAIFIPRSFIRNFFGVTIAQENMKYLAIITLVTRISEIVFITFVILFRMGFLPLFIASFLAEMLGFIVCLLLFRKTFSLSSIKVDAAEMKTLFKECLPITLSLFLLQAFLYVNVFVLKILSDNTNVGLFQVPHKILMRLQAFPMAFFIASLPVYSRLASSPETLKDFNALFVKTVKWILILALPFSVMGVFFSEDIILLLFGEKYFESAGAFAILVIGVPALCLTTLQRYIFIALKRQRLIMASDAVCVFSNLALDIILVPEYGYIGASIGTVAAVSLQCIINFVVLKYHLRNIAWHKDFGGPVVASVFFGLIFFFIDKAYSLFMFPVGLALYVAVLLFLKSISRKDVAALRRSRSTDS